MTNFQRIGNPNPIQQVDAYLPLRLGGDALVVKRGPICGHCSGDFSREGLLRLQNGQTQRKQIKIRGKATKEWGKRKQSRVIYGRKIDLTSS